MCVFCAPTILLPTTFLEYCTGILLSANVTNTTPTTKTNTAKTNKIALINPTVLNAPLTTTNVPNCVIAAGIDETIPANINIEIPFPIPFVVILSPSHASNWDPATSDKTTINPVIFDWTKIPEFLYDI